MIGRSKTERPLGERIKLGKKGVTERQQVIRVQNRHDDLLTVVKKTKYQTDQGKGV